MGTPRVVVIGGGISGLSAAHALTTSNIPVDVTLLEATSLIGGKLLTHEVGGIALDAGAESVLARRPEAIDLIADVGLSDSLVRPAVSGASVVVDGSLRRLPSQQLLGIPADIDDVVASGVLDEAGLAELRRDLVTSTQPISGDLTVGALVRRRMGDQVLDRLVEPLLGGVYAGSADRISADMALPGLVTAANQHPSLMAAVRSLRTGGDGAPFASLAGGLGRLPQAIVDAAGLEVRTQNAATALLRQGKGWVVETRSASQTHRLPADAVIVACQAQPAAELLRPHVSLAGDALTLEYASVALATFVFRGSHRPAVPPGTGFLVSPSEARLVKAATFSSQKWQWLADAHPDALVIRASMGRFGDNAVGRQTDEQLTHGALVDLQDILSFDEQPSASALARWERSLPQYEAGHRDRITQLRHELASLPGLDLCGAAADGVGIPACIASGQSAATRVAEGLGIGRQ